MFIPGSFIKWTGTDADGSFSVVGLITSYEPESRVEFMDMTGSVNSVPYDDGMWTPAKKPKGWDSGIEAIVAHKPKKKMVSTQCVAPIPPTPKPKKPRVSGGVSKKILGRAIFENNKEAGRAAIIQALMDELDMTKAGAGTYYANYNAGRW